MFFAPHSSPRRPEAVSLFAHTQWLQAGEVNLGYVNVTRPASLRDKGLTRHQWTKIMSRRVQRLGDRPFSRSAQARGPALRSSPGAPAPKASESPARRLVITLPEAYVGNLANGQPAEFSECWKAD